MVDITELQAGPSVPQGPRLTGEEGCAKVYDDVALNLQLLAVRPGQQPRAGQLGPVQRGQHRTQKTMNLQVWGGAMNWVTGGGNIAVLAYPNVGIGLRRNWRPP